jgi:hypothetical protein
MSDDGQRRLGSQRADVRSRIQGKSVSESVEVKIRQEQLKRKQEEEKCNESIKNRVEV